MKSGPFLFLTLLLTINVCGQNVSKIGMTTRGFADETRPDWSGRAPRPIATTIWYPADAPENEAKIVLGNPDNPLFIAGAAVRGAKISAARERFPLIVISHGTGGSALQMMWLGQYLAARGFIAAAIDHHGNSAAEGKYRAQGFVLWWERARDLRVAIDDLLADAEFGGRIDAGKIGAAGFSLGGATVTATAGGIFDLRGFEKFCASSERDATCEPQPEFPGAMKEFEELRTKDASVIESLNRAADSYRDRRVKAVFAIAPALGAAFTQSSLSSVEIPFQIVAGEADATTPPRTNAQKLARSIKKSAVKILPGKVGHYTFLAECTDFGKTILPICRDEAGVDRAAVHRTVGQMAFEFFKANL
ncbi:MAG TPA: hypothetical protein VIL74_15280 [Pyrinomonadaceae bacterium]|jgi:predicted dienelactone hydrolase